MLPKDEKREKEHAADEERDNVYRTQSITRSLLAVQYETCSIHHVHPVFQPSGAEEPSLRTKMMEMRPAVTRNAPSQSIRLQTYQHSHLIMISG